jgi:hypothetical protein
LAYILRKPLKSQGQMSNRSKTLEYLRYWISLNILEEWINRSEDGH